VDWLPTIIHGIAGLPLSLTSKPKYTYQPPPPPLDGMDVWESLSQGTPSPRKELLIELDPFDCFTFGSCNIPGRGAIRIGKWKLIHGHTGMWDGQNWSPGNTSNCYPRDGSVQTGLILNITPATSPPFCPTGWVPPPGSGLPIIPPPDVLACHDENGNPKLPCSVEGTPYLTGSTWLFDVVGDPFERVDVSSVYPEIVAQLLSRLQQFNATKIPQSRSPVDPRSDPSRFGGVWTPWRGNPNPQTCDPNTTSW